MWALFVFKLLHIANTAGLNISSVEGAQSPHNSNQEIAKVVAAAQLPGITNATAGQLVESSDFSLLAWALEDQVQEALDDLAWLCSHWAGFDGRGEDCP